MGGWLTAAGIAFPDLGVCPPDLEVCPPDLEVGTRFISGSSFRRTGLLLYILILVITVYTDYRHFTLVVCGLRAPAWLPHGRWPCKYLTYCYVWVRAQP